MKYLKWSALTLTFCGLFGFAVAPAWGISLTVISQNGPQDPLTIAGDVHELGDSFPVDEAIVSSWVETDQTSCFEPGNIDDPSIPNILVTMTNLSPQDWLDVHYVADYDPDPPPGGFPAQWVTVSNFDGWIGNGPGDLSQAFRIDNVGPWNFPLVSESMAPDLIFQSGEVWEFILQDWAVAPGVVGSVGPTPFGSIGIAGASPNASLSTGSIIAKAIPEPSTVAVWGLLILCGIGIGWRRRRKA